jgi:hypothetical protein
MIPLDPIHEVESDVDMSVVEDTDTFDVPASASNPAGTSLPEFPSVVVRNTPNFRKYMSLSLG